MGGSGSLRSPWVSEAQACLFYMDQSLFETVVGKLLERDSRYHADAYEFVRSVVEELTAAANSRGREARPSRKGKMTAQHVNGAQILAAARSRALGMFGPMVPTVFEHWGILKTRDVGNIVFNLIEGGYFSASETDRIEDFDEGFDFHEAFVKPYLPETEGGADRLRKPRGGNRRRSTGGMV